MSLTINFENCPPPVAAVTPTTQNATRPVDLSTQAPAKPYQRAHREKTIKRVYLASGYELKEAEAKAKILQGLWVFLL